ncbi:MAG: hypothetical protein GX334_07510 [Firmicutes bacterium]|nr:hypothetical protein [Bacillota bacterium]
MSAYKVTFNCGALTLEGSLARPQKPAPWAAVLLCHPHPLYGGNMDNNVIQAVSEKLVSQGLAALRFNFRGVGGSEGSFDDGKGEEMDAHAALTFLRNYEGIEANKIGILGYSFGGLVALTAGVKNDLVQAVGGISPIMRPGILQNCLKPVLLAYGTKDDVIDPKKIISESEGSPGQALVETIAGADHFFWGYEKEVAEKMAAFFVRQLCPGQVAG